MRAIGPSKPMVSVEGTALLERVIRNAMDGGVNDFVVVTGYNGRVLQDFLSNLSKRIACSITTVENKDWHLGNGRFVLAAKSVIGEPFHALMADHLIDPNMLKVVRQNPLLKHGARLAVDLRLQNPHVDVDDVTKVLCKDESILEIGKSLTAFNAFDTGVFWCTLGLIDAIEESIDSQDDDSLSGGVRILAAKGLMQCCDIGNRTWIDVDTPALLGLAQEAMIQQSSLSA